MKRSITTSLTLAACLTAASLLTGCGKSSPTAPQVAADPGPAQVLFTSLRWDYVVCHVDGDLVGAGDFEFKRFFDRYNALHNVTMSTGDVWQIKKFNSATGEGTRFKVAFEATEWDKNLIGENVRDADMNKRYKSRTHTIAEGLNGQYSFTLGNDDCKVQVYYTLSTVYVDAGSN